MYQIFTITIKSTLKNSNNSLERPRCKSVKILSDSFPLENILHPSPVEVPILNIGLHKNYAFLYREKYNKINIIILHISDT
jgi:hypothetical protein